MGWTFSGLEGIRFTRTNSLQFLSNTVAKNARSTDQLAFDGRPASPQLKQVLASGGPAHVPGRIGAFSRRARLTTHFAVSMADVPAHAVGPA